MVYLAKLTREASELLPQGLVNGWQVGSIDVKVRGRRILRQESVAITS